jgi:hypothetical protein
MTWRRLLFLGLCGLAAVLLLLWLARARLAGELARQYFQSHGIASSVEVESLGFAGSSGRFALGPAVSPDIAADRIELRFDPLRWMPYVVEVRLVHPVIHARMDGKGRISLPNLQRWIDSLGQGGGKSSYVSDELAVSLQDLQVFLASPYGALELGGDLTLRRNLPLTASLTVKPGLVAYQGMTLRVKGARLDFDAQQGKVTARLDGSLRRSGLALEDFRADIAADGLRWSFAGDRAALEAPNAKVTLTALRADMGVSVGNPRLALSLRDAALSGMGGAWSGHAELSGMAGADFRPDAVKTLLAGERALADATAANLRHLELSLNGHVESADGRFKFAMAEPLTVKGAAGGLLQVPVLTLEGAPKNLHGILKAALSGKGLPSITLDLPQWSYADSSWQSQLSATARFDYAMLRGVSLQGSGMLAGKGADWRFDLKSCARLNLKAFHPGATNLAENLAGSLCPVSAKPLLALDPKGWRLMTDARGMGADLPLANVRAEQADGMLDFSGGAQMPPQGTVNLVSARMTDRVKSPRFHPMTGAGTITLKKNIWQGRLAVTEPAGKTALGTVTFAHDMATAKGAAHIAAPKLAFADGKLQPETLSPLLAAFKHADGTAEFSGDVQWNPKAITSSGRLAIANLDFLTPLGKAHGVKTTLDFRSLLPPATGPGQTLTISRIDWTLPLTNLTARFAFRPTEVSVDAVDTAIAEGHVALGPFAINPASPGKIQGTADIKSIALSALIAASNLEGKVKLEGKVSGHIPFTAGPEGFRIAKGQLKADGVGRLSIDRALWAQGDGAATTNAVQGFAYQALENLSYEQLSAELNSVAGGRLQAVFRIKGKSDPPKPQEAQVGLMELLNGTALQKPIPLPSNTPIDLTLDTSLNFDELLKSYAEAWSKTLSQDKTD